MRFLPLFSVVLFFLISVVSGHNWMNTPSRALVASVTSPCQARVGTAPHIQVIAGQTHEMEWSLGHGDTGTLNTYIITLHSDDYDLLKFVTQADIESYLKAAPPASLMTGPAWTRRHVNKLNPFPLDGVFTNNSQPMWFDNPFYLNREPTMVAKSINAARAAFQYQYLSQHTDLDVRASYYNPLFPWIEAAHRFVNVIGVHTLGAGDVDLASFAVPARKGAGDYIHFFLWGGYRDCVDVNVMPGTTPVVNRYGISGVAANSFYKLNHCEFTFILNTRKTCRIMPRATLSAQQCMTDCLADSSCTGIQVVRMTNPAGTLPYTPSIPIYWFNATQRSGTFPPYATGTCGSVTIHGRKTAGCPVVDANCDPSKMPLSAAQPDDYICYTLQPYRDQDFQAADDYVIATEAEDPKYYSTCYFKVGTEGFLNVPKPQPERPNWVAGQEKCLRCSFRESVLALNLSQTPRWTDGLADQCTNCDRIGTF